MKGKYAVHLFSLITLALFTSFKIADLFVREFNSLFTAQFEQTNFLTIESLTILIFAIIGQFIA